MTKAELVNEISKNTGIEKVTVLKAVEAFMDSVKSSLVNGDNVLVPSLSRKELRKPLVTSPRTQLSLFRSTTFLRSNRLQSLLTT